MKNRKITGQKYEKDRRLGKLFLSTLYLSAFTFGGGYVIVSLMKKKFVDEYGWIDEKEMLDYVSIAQSAPGPIAVNGAIVVGYKIAGVLGLFVAVLGTVIASVTYELFCGIAAGKSRLSMLIMAAAFAATFFLKVNAVYVILACILIGIFHTLVKEKKT